MSTCYAPGCPHPRDNDLDFCDYHAKVLATATTKGTEAMENVKFTKAHYEFIAAFLASERARLNYQPNCKTSDFLRGYVMAVDGMIERLALELQDLSAYRPSATLSVAISQKSFNLDRFLIACKGIEP